MSEREPEWRSEWDQLKSFRGLVSQGLKDGGLNDELVATFTDLFMENAGRRLEEDPETAREYMRHVSEIIYGGKR